VKPESIVLFLGVLVLTSSLPVSLRINYGNAAVAYTDVSAEEAYELINTTPSLFILDVRTLDEYKEGHIQKAVLIPHDELENQADDLPADLQAPILVYCHSGGRSAAASQTLALMNYSQVNNLLGGFISWKNAGYPYETGIPSQNGSSAATLTSEEVTSAATASIPGFFILIGLISLSGQKIRTKRRQRQ
jgi:phage shock protein E